MRTKNCPHCQSQIYHVARVCNHCNRSVAANPLPWLIDLAVLMVLAMIYLMIRTL